MRFAMEEMPHVQIQIQNQTMSQNVTKEPKYVVQINLNLRKILVSHKIFFYICLFVLGLGLDVSRQAHSLPFSRQM